ncbi:MAG: FAD-dependent oxidoreductase [Mycobacteriales bacterium]
MPERHAVVAGAGIAGLATAAALTRTGWRVTVLERAEGPGDAGAAISLWGNALRALDRLDLGDRVREVGGRPGTGGSLRRPDGRHLVRPAAVDGMGVEVVLLLRADLHRLLRAAVPDGSLHLGVPVTGLAARGVRAGDREIAADLVVGADGIHSTVRSAGWPDASGPRYAGYTTWRGVTARPVPGEYGETWGRGARFGAVPLRDGRVYWYATANRPEGVADVDPHAEVARRFAGWHPLVPALIAATEPENVLHLDVREAPALDSYVAGHTVLVGDAAHAMTPDLGQGACQAIEDAVVLAAELRTADGPAAVAAALRRYDLARRPRTRGVARTARRLGRFGQVDGRLATALRDLAVRLTPPRAAARSLGRVAGWTPPTLDGHAEAHDTGVAGAVRRGDHLQ